MKINRLTSCPDFEESLGVEVEDGEFHVVLPEEITHEYPGFKTQGVSCCFAIVAILIQDNEQEVPIALGHYVPVSSDEDIENAKLDVESFIDDMNPVIDEHYGNSSLYYMCLGGVNSSKNTYDAIQELIQEGNYGIRSVEYNIAPSEHSAVDIYVDRYGIHYAQHPEPSLSFLSLSSREPITASQSLGSSSDNNTERVALNYSSDLSEDLVGASIRKSIGSPARVFKKSRA